jgi:hypothetical protein
MSVWSYHQWFGYPFAMLFMWEWVHCNPWYTLKYCCSYRIRKWNSCTEEVSHLFLHHTGNWMDIFITKNSFWTLTNVVIIDPTHINLVQHALTTTMHAITIIVQNKAWSYTKWTPRDDFIPLAIKTYDCFHLHFDSLFTSCVHANIIYHQQTSLVHSMFISYYKQRMSIALQHVQAIAILQWATMFNHNSSSLPHIPTNAPPSLIDLWQRMPF